MMWETGRTWVKVRLVLRHLDGLYHEGISISNPLYVA